MSKAVDAQHSITPQPFRFRYGECDARGVVSNARWRE